MAVVDHGDASTSFGPTSLSTIGVMVDPWLWSVVVRIGDGNTWCEYGEIGELTAIEWKVAVPPPNHVSMELAWFWSKVGLPPAPGSPAYRGHGSWCVDLRRG